MGLTVGDSPGAEITTMSNSSSRLCRAHQVSLVVGVAKREEICVCEVVFSSVAWGLICSAWGASVSRIICNNLELEVILTQLHPTRTVERLDNFFAKKLPPIDSQVLVSSCSSMSDLSTLSLVIDLVVVKVIMISLPSSFSRKAVGNILGYNRRKEVYSFRLSSVAHELIGGASTSSWIFAILVRHDLDWTPPRLHFPPLPPVSIFNMIDDKIGGGFKPIPQRAWKTLRDAKEKAWDLSLHPTSINYWVRCPSVYSPKSTITRSLELHEISALWDFQLPDSCELHPSLHKSFVISLLHGPPGKMLKKIAYAPLRFLWKLVDSPSSPEKIDRVQVDYSSVNVEEMATKLSHLKAVRSDDAPIDFEIWMWPNESESETRARNLLRMACHSFWRLNLLREALTWLNSSPDSLPSERKVNIDAIVDCLTRTANSTFWDWADGSRLLFWRWLQWWKSARDGEVLFHEAPHPKWMGKSLPAPSWHYELLLRKKEEKLIHRRYLEFGFVDCVVPRFGVPKGEDDI